jgi:predicted nucleotidyltransferase
MLDLKPHELEVVRNILNRFVPEAEIIVFGSRVHGTAKPWSDLDLAIKAESALDWKLLEDIKETFQESELPFRVDILDWNEITDAFRRVIETKGYEPLP